MSHVNFKAINKVEAAWVIDVYIDESKRKKRVQLAAYWPELHDALETLSTGFVPVRSSRAD